MTPHEMKIASGALKRESAKWAQEQPNLTKIANTLASLQFTRTEAGLFQIMFSAYESCRSVVEDRAREGAAEFGRMSDTLADLSVIYNRADESVAAAAHELIKARW